MVNEVGRNPIPEDLVTGVHERLYKAHKKSGFSFKEVLNKLEGMNLPSVESTIKKHLARGGKGLPPHEYIIAYAELFGTTTDYILTGKEPKIKEVRDPNNQQSYFRALNFLLDNVPSYFNRSSITKTKPPLFPDEVAETYREELISIAFDKPVFQDYLDKLMNPTVGDLIENGVLSREDLVLASIRKCCYEDDDLPF